MANTLMFEVGVKEAGNQLSDLERRLKELVDKYGSMKIKVEVDKLQDFIKALETIGNGKVLDPLLKRIDMLHASLSVMGGAGAKSMQEFEMAAKANTAIADRYRKEIERLTQVRDKFVENSPSWRKANEELTAFKQDKTTMSIFALEKTAIDNLANAQSKLQSEEKKTESSSADLNAKIQQLADSITTLANKSGSVKLEGDFTKWAQEVNGVTTAVRELVEQLKQLNQVHGQATQQSGFSINSGFNDWVQQQIDAAQRFISVNRDIEKALQTELKTTALTYSDFFRKGDKEEQYGLAALKKDILNAYGNISDESGLNKLREHIKEVNRLIQETEEKVANGKIAPYKGNMDLHVYEERLKLLKEIEKQAVGANQATNGDVYNQLKSRGIKIDEESVRVKNQAIQAQEKLNQVETQQPKVQQGGIFDTQKFTTLQEAIDKIIREINRLKEAFSGIGKIEGITQLTTDVNGLMHNVNNLKDVLSSLSGAVKLTGSADDIAAYEAKIKDLKGQVEALQTTIKQANEGIKTVASGKGSEAIQNTNLDTLRAQLEKVTAAYEKMLSEYERMKASGAENQSLKERIELLGQYKAHLESVAKMDLSKAGALKANDVKFNDQLLFGQINKQMYSDKTVKEFSKLVDETIKAKNVADSLNDAFERMKQHVLGVGTAGSGGMRGVSSMMESINTIGERNIQTLIKERAHVERLIAMAEKSIKFGEGHDVAGMQGLRVQQRENLEYLNNVKNAINYILENRNVPEWMRFLNTPGSLKIPLAGSGNDIALLGGHFDALTHSVTGTSQAMRQLNKDMRLDNLTQTNRQWNTDNLKKGLYNVEQQIDAIKAAWAKVGDGADAGLTRSVAQMMNSLNDLKTRISSAMNDDSLLGSRRGYMQVLNADSEIQLKNAKALNTQLTQMNSEREKAEARQLREAEKYTEQSKRAYAKAEKEKADAIKQTEKEQEAARKKQEQADNQAIRDMQVRETGQRRYNGLLKDMDNLMSKMESRKNAGSLLGVDTAKTEQAMQRLQQFIDKTLNMDVRNFGDRHYMSEYVAQWQALKKELVEVSNAQKKANDAQEKMNGAAVKAQSSEYKILQKNTQDARREAEKLLEEREKLLRSQAQSLGNILTGGKGKLDAYQYEQVRDALRAIREELRQIDAAKQRGGLSTEALFSLGGGTKEFSALIAAYKQFISGKQEATSANSKLSLSEQQLANSIKGSTDYMKSQSQVLSDLKMMAMQYLSVWGAQSFIHNIIELGGQLEQQRLSIGAILQDTAQANHLFGQIKDLAIRSPFGVQQLDAMTKQLSAYGFQYSELYEWTKRLADISAATGTSVDRLALALGHVRSEGALSGYTLRQFSMGNIPLLQKLSENLGKTKQEIRKMTRNKEIGYEDVLNVLKQLTDEGGMFFEAQETMAEALNAKFKNLRDSFQIMYSEMAEGAPGDFLKKVAETLTDISKAWRILMPLVIAGGGAFGMWKAATIAFNYEAAHTGKLMTMNALATSKYSVAQLRAIATTGRFTLALKGAGRTLASLGKFLISPWTLGFAAVEGLIYLWSKHNDEVRKAEDLTKSYSETAKESQKNIGKQLESVEPYNDKLSDSEMKTGIESMTEAIKNYSVSGQNVLNDMAESAMSLAEKYQYLRSELEKTNKVYKEMERTAGAFEYGIKNSDSGWYDDNVETDLTQYATAFKDFEDAVTEFSSKYGDALKNSIDAAKKADPEFAKATEKMTSYAQMLAEIWENQGKYKEAVNAAPFLFGEDIRSIYYNGSSGYLNYESKKREAMKELDEFFVNTEARLKEKGYDFTKELAPEQIGNLLKQSKDWLEKHPEWSNIYDVIYDKLNQRWGIKIEPDPQPVEEKLPKWIEDFQKELDGTGIKLTANMKMEQVIDEMKKVYDTAQTTINKLGPIAMQAKINFTGLKKEDIEYLRIKDPELYNTLSELIDAQEKKNAVDTAAKKRGVKLEGMKKDGSHKAEKQNQEAAKAVREQVRVIKEAADAFQYWRDKVGDKGAWEHVKAEFGDVLAKIGVTADNISDVRSHLKNIPKMKEYRAITDKKVRTEIDKEIAKENDQYNRKDFEKSTEDFASKVQIELDSLTRAWEIFNNVREATGNIELAVQLSGVDYANGQNRNIADVLKEKIQKDFDAAGGSIAFDLNLSDEQIEDKIKAAIPAASEKQIKGLVAEYKKWRDLQRDVVKTDITAFGKLLGSVVDYRTELEKVNDEYYEQKEALDSALSRGDINRDQYNRGLSILDTQRDTKEWEMSTAYINLMNNSLAMTRTEIEAAAQSQEASLNRQLENGVITAQKYAEEMAKLRKITVEWSTNGFLGSRGAFGSFVSGGNQGLLEYYQRRATKARTEAGKEQDPYARQVKINEAERYENLYKSLVKVTEEAQKVYTAFQTLKNGVDLLGNLFDSLGWEGGANAMSDTSDLLGGALGGASSLSALGPYGMAAGAALGFASSLFALHDKSIQRQIEAIQDEVDALESNTEAIKRSRERTLGYDAGTLRRRMADQYKDTRELKTIETILGDFTVEYQSAAKKAMQEYYKMNSSGTGYSQELENLKKQREDYIKMYDLENDKKKESQEALNEYKEKIAELDDQIAYFAQDLANELFSIDIKSWADQIGDSLMTAFENGEDAAEAFNDTVRDIMRQTLRNMLSIGIIQPMMERLQKRLFGENGKGGSFDAMNPEGTIDAAMRDIADFFGEDGEGQRMIGAAQTFYEKWEDFMKSQGLTLEDTDKSSSTGSSIKGITEQTADLIASYLNACRADLSVNRAMIAQYFPMYYNALTAGNSSLRNIENHTAAIMRSNDAIQRSNDAILDRIDGLRNKTWKMPMA